MPLPMVHLAIAIEMCSLHNTAPTPNFLLGHISPDAIHMRAGSNRTDKARTHLLDAADGAMSMQEYQQHVYHQLLDQHHKPDARAFAEGYAAHILTDWLWRQMLAASYSHRVPTTLTREERRRLYYQQTDQIDIYLYQRMAWRPQAWAQLAASTPHDFQDLLTATEITQWRARTLVWYDKPENNPNIEPRYISYEHVLDFIADTAANLTAQFHAWTPDANIRH